MENNTDFFRRSHLVSGVCSCNLGAFGVWCLNKINNQTRSIQCCDVFFVRMSAMEKILMTRAGHAALSAELKNLTSVERPAIIQAIAEAREHGDLSENAEYHSAREKHSFIEGRVKELEGILSLSQIIDPKSLSGAVKFSATVTIVDEDTDEEKTYQIVGEHEADIENGLLNIKSPIARALISKEEGDSVDVRTPGGLKSYEILKVEYI